MTVCSSDTHFSAAYQNAVSKFIQRQIQSRQAAQVTVLQLLILFILRNPKNVEQKPRGNQTQFKSRNTEAPPNLSSKEAQAFEELRANYAEQRIAQPYLTPNA